MFPVNPREMKFIIRQESERDRELLRANQRVFVKPDLGPAEEPIELYLAADSVIVPKGMIVGNKRSRRYYLATDKAYRRAARQKNVLWFQEQASAESAGYLRG